MNKWLITFVFVLFLFGVAFATDYMYDSQNLNLHDIFNATNINSTNFYQDGNKVCDNSNNCLFVTNDGLLAFGYYNASDFVITDYFNKTELLAFNYYNSTNIPDYILSSSEGDLNVNSSNYWDGLDGPLDSWTSTYNSTYDSYNATGLIKDWNSTGWIIDWNSTGLIINWSFVDTNTDCSADGSCDNIVYLDYTNIGSLNVSGDICITGGNCLSDAGTGSGDITSVNTNGEYLTGGSSSGDVNLLLNETKLNQTIDDRDSDTTYTAGSNLTLIGTQFSLDTTSVLEWLDNIYLAIGSAFSGSWNDLTDIPAGFADNIDNDTQYSHLTNFTNDLGIGNWTQDKVDYFTSAEILAFGYYNSTDFVITDYFTKSDILGFGYYNATDFSIDDYFTSSQVLAFDYYNSSDFNISDYITSAEVLGFNYYNSTDFDISNYYTKTDIDGFNYYNSTTIPDYILSSSESNLNVNSSNYWDGYDAPTGWDLNASDDITELTEGSNITITETENSRTIGINIATLITYLDTIYQAVGNYITTLTNFGGDITGTYDNLQLGSDVVGDSEINYTQVTLDDFTNDAGFITSYTDTNASTACSGTTTYLDGEGNCDDISSTYIASANEGNLNVNSSSYWDGLNSPSDINTVDLTDDNTFVQVAGDTMTGSLNITDGNMSVDSGNKICLTQDCTKYMYYNGTNIVIQG